ncbi:hypothetical protein [uncultured Methanomethylovorans sp.]|uniref:hypothetical protein n=1 Tax=uncultured Methanomethylovorans sp. TaxID=183759 RepID=UPI002AA85D88|nr:hypothetical protein [uncultured Methanomethylovorans sp.]
MNNRKSLLICLIVFFALFSSGCADINNGNTSSYNEPAKQELNLTITTEKLNFTEDEHFVVYYKLTNVGKYPLDVLKIMQYATYDISFSPVNSNGSVKYICGVPSVTPPTNKDIVQLESGESLNATIDSSCWTFTPGEYIITASYHASGGNKIPNRYWSGEVESNEILIKVREN